MRSRPRVADAQRHLRGCCSTAYLDAGSPGARAWAGRPDPRSAWRNIAIRQPQNAHPGLQSRCNAHRRLYYPALHLYHHLLGDVFLRSSTREPGKFPPRPPVTASERGAQWGRGAAAPRRSSVPSTRMARRRALDVQGETAMADGPVDEEQQEAGVLHARTLVLECYHTTLMVRAPILAHAHSHPGLSAAARANGMGFFAAAGRSLGALVHILHLPRFQVFACPSTIRASACALACPCECSAVSQTLPRISHISAATNPLTGTPTRHLAGFVSWPFYQLTHAPGAGRREGGREGGGESAREYVNSTFEYGVFVPPDGASLFGLCRPHSQHRSHFPIKNDIINDYLCELHASFLPPL